MPKYTLYFLDDYDEILREQRVDADSDEHAQSCAMALDHASAIEVWDGVRKVALVSPAGHI